jgi:hypothetical protein
MKIARIAPLAESVPPRLYGGMERVVSYLADELVGLGHEVTLFASADSSTRARLLACAPRALCNRWPARRRPGPPVRPLPCCRPASASRWLTVRGLRIGEGRLDLMCRRHDSGVAVSLLGRAGDADVQVMR